MKSWMLLVGAIVFVGGAAFIIDDEENPLGDSSKVLTPTSVDSTGESGFARTRQESDPISIVTVTESVHASCTEANAELVAKNDEFAIRIAELEGVVANFVDKETQNLLMEYPPDTPFGALLRSYDSLDQELVANREARDSIEAFLIDLPIHLHPGEASRIYREIANGGWKNRADNPTTALVSLLGGFDAVYGRLIDPRFEGRYDENAADLAEFYTSEG